MALIFNNLVLDIITSVTISLLITLYIYFTWTFDFWKKRGVPFLKPTVFVGNFGKWVTLKLNIGMLFKSFYDETKHQPFVGIWVFRKPALVINSQELIKTVLVKDFAHFSDRATYADREYDSLGADSLFFGRNPEWKNIRVKITPLFSSSKMKLMFELMNEIGLQLVEHVEENVGKTIEIKDTMGKYTTDVIATTAFGLKANSLKDPDSIFNVFRKKLLEFGLYRMMQFMAMFFYQDLAKYLRTKVFEHESEDWMRSVFWKTVEERERTKEERNDLIGTLIALKNQTQFDDKISFTGDTLVAQVATFLFAGNETSSSTITFALYELAVNPDSQDKLSAEISQVLAKYDNKVTYESIQEMTYLDMVFKETIRLYPVLSFLDRQCTMPYKIPNTDIVLPKGTSVYIPVSGLHLDPEYFPDPTAFKPERFDKDNCHTIKPFTFLPFGEGPRMCIGARYGTLKSKMGLVHLLSKYYVRPCSETQIPLKLLKYTLSPTVEDGVYLKFVPK